MSFTARIPADTKFKKYIFHFLFLFSIIDLVYSGPSSDYCKLPCRSGKNIYKNTVCMRKNKCGPVSGCHPLENTVAFRELMVKQHNEFRNKIASGQDGGSQYGNKGATNMNAVSYDMELEYIAQCWANTCEHSHDKCRRTERFFSGQNIFWGTNSTHGVESWYKEIRDITNPAWIDSLPRSFPDDKQRGHFTQIVWAKTKYIGCARVRYGDSAKTQLICNYGPRGNLYDQSVYKMADDKSEIASECQQGRNNIYSSLCGRIDPIPTEESWADGSDDTNGSADGMVAKLLLVQFCVVLGYFVSRFLL